MCSQALFGDSRLPERFWTKVHVASNDCWIWTGGRNHRGYGHFKFGEWMRRTHRLTYETMVGVIPDGLQLDHLCRDRACCNPQHLEPVTGRENSARGLKGVLHTHCPHGHEFLPDNTGLNNRGHRFCRTCGRLRDRERHRRSRLARLSRGA